MIGDHRRALCQSCVFWKHLHAVFITRFYGMHSRALQFLSWLLAGLHLLLDWGEPKHGRDSALGHFSILKPLQAIKQEMTWIFLIYTEWEGTCSSMQHPLLSSSIQYHLKLDLEWQIPFVFHRRKRIMNKRYV